MATTKTAVAKDLLNDLTGLTPEAADKVQELVAKVKAIAHEYIELTSAAQQHARQKGEYLAAL